VSVVALGTPIGARTKWDFYSPLGCTSRHVTNNVLNQSDINAVLYLNASCCRESINITRQAFKEVRLVQQRGARSARNPRTPADKPLEPGNSKALSTRFW
jgi:hypothetical protein